MYYLCHQRIRSERSESGINDDLITVQVNDDLKPVRQGNVLICRDADDRPAFKINHEVVFSRVNGK